MIGQIHQRFGPFLILRTLGRGGMGEVYVARTPWDAHPLAAVKRLRPDVARVPTFAERFQHEAELAVRLSHPNVVGTLDVGVVEGQLYVASELVFGKDTGLIADRLRERGQGGPAAVAIRLLSDTLTALAYVHGAVEVDGRPLMLVHRDITPGNLLVGYDGVVRIADFGLAKSALTEKSHLTSHGEILGTPHYLAPEVVRGEPATPASDLYGLGAVLYRFLTGVPLYDGGTSEVLFKVLSAAPTPLDELRPDLPRWLTVFVHRLLEKDLSRRPSDAEVLLRQITREARSAGLLVPREAAGEWLTRMFEVEHGDELRERERLGRLPIEDPDASYEGTVVLARPRSETRIPGSLSAIDGLGTELELDRQEIERIASELGAMPVQAVRGQGAALDGAATRPVPAYIDEPDDERTAIVGGDSDDSLPGFIDPGPSSRKGAKAQRGGEGEAGEPASIARRPRVVVRERRAPAPPDAGRTSPSGRRGAAEVASARGSLAHELRRRPLVLLGVLLLAVALGIGIGALVASF